MGLQASISQLEYSGQSLCASSVRSYFYQQITATPTPSLYMSYLTKFSLLNLIFEIDGSSADARQAHETDAKERFGIAW